MESYKFVFATARRAPGSFPSALRPGAFSNAGRAAGSPFVFPSPRDPARPRSRNLAFWYRARHEAGIDGRSPSRSAPYPCQSRGDERRAGSGRHRGRSYPGCLVIPMCGRRCVTPIWEIARSRQRPREWDNPSPRSYASRMCIPRCVGSATPSASGSCGPARGTAPGAGGASHRPLRSRRRSP